MGTRVTYRAILALAWPIYGGLFATTIVGLVDIAFLGRVGLEEQSAAGYAALFWLVFFVIAMGFTLGMQILIARRSGEGRYSSIGRIFWNGIFCLLVYSGLICIFFNTGIHAFFDLITRSPEISRLTGDYLRYRSFGFFGSMMNLAFMAYYVGKGKSFAISLAAFCSAFINILLDYVLIFGHFGMEAMGLRGAAIASGIADLCGTLVFVVFTCFQRDLKKLGMLTGIKFSLEQLRELFRLSVPLILQNTISIAAWFLFFTIIEKTSERNFGISIIVRTIYSIYMMSAIALGSTTNSMVSNLIGQGRQNEVLPLIRKAATFSGIFMGVTAISLAIFPVEIFMLFTNDHSLATDARYTMYVLVSALMVFSVAMTYYQAVSGTGKTLVALMLEVISISFYLAYTFLMAHLSPDKVHLIWIAETVYMLLFGIMALAYMKSGKWIQ